MAHVGQEAGLGAAGLLRQRLLHFDLLLPLLHLMINIKKDQQSRDDQNRLHQIDQSDGTVHRAQHLLQALRRLLRDKLRHRLIHPCCRCLQHPDARSKDDQSEQNDPGDNGAAKPALLVRSQNETEYRKTEDSPCGKDQVGLGRQGFHRGKIRNQEFQGKQNGDGKAGKAGCNHSPVPLLPRRLPCRSGGKRVGDGGPDRSHINDPADRRPAEKRKNNRDAENRVDRMSRRSFLVPDAKRLRKQSILREGSDQSAQGDIVADEPRKNPAKRRASKQSGSRPSHRGKRREESRLGFHAGILAQVRHIIRP